MGSRSRRRDPRCSLPPMPRAPFPRRVVSPTCWRPSDCCEHFRIARPSRPRVAEEPLPGLVAKPATRNQRSQQLNRCPALIAGLTEALVEDRLDDVEPDQVGQLERSHRPTQGVPNREIAVVDGDVALLHEPHRLLDRDEQDAIRDEPVLLTGEPYG